MVHHWQWQVWQGLPYLTCSLLEPWFHGFFTRQFSPRPPQALVEVLQPSATVYRVKQVHGNAVLTASEVSKALMSQAELYPEADGIVTERGEQAVWVCSADCTPVLIADRTTGQVAAVHAGWRGTGLKIVSEAIARLQKQGSQIQDLLVAMGPAIAGEVYQVQEEVATKVISTITSDASLEAVAQFSNSPIFPDPEPGKVRLDVRRVNAIQLEQLGLAPEQVAIAPNCTYADAEQFFSYRRDKQKNVQWSGIVSFEGKASSR